MKKIYTSIVISLFSIILFGQSNQYIHFDGQNDYISVENGAQYINGLSAFSMTGWFYADKLQYGAGMMGIRGERQWKWTNLFASVGKRRFRMPN
ncbi:MAG: hypothetical protein R2777_06815 [Chitinophagales bacterium]